MKKIDGDGATLVDRMENYPYIGMVFFLEKKKRKRDQLHIIHWEWVKEKESLFIRISQQILELVNNKSQMSKKR